MTGTALVIGGAGQIGLAASEALQRSGFDVTVAHRGRAHGRPAFDVREVVLDREDTPALRKAAAGHDVVVDVVAYTPAHAHQLAALAGDVGSLVVISTGSVYVDSEGRYFDVTTGDADYPRFPVPIDEDVPTIPSGDTYGPLKAAMERELLAVDDLAVSILRPGAVHGPLAPKLREWYFIKRVLDGRDRVVLSRLGRSRFSTSSSANVGAVVAACALRPGHRVLNAVDEEHLSTADIARTVFAAFDREVEVFGFDGPPRGDLGATPWDAAHDFVCSMQRARDEVGYEPRFTYAEAVQADIEWVLAALEAEGGGPTAWQRLFPGVVTRYGADGWFPYALEDDTISGGGASPM